MQTLAEIRSLLDAYGLSPKKSLGQNFLIDQNLIRSLVDASGVQADDLVLEIGPGTGTMTEELLARGCRVIACELDDGLSELLSGRFESETADRFRLIRGDCLANKRSLNPDIESAIGNDPFRLVANLPYGAASPLMIQLARDARCLGQYVTVQREVAERVRASNGTREYSEMSVLIQACSIPKKLATLPPACFWPRPKVTSEMLAIEPLDAEFRLSDERYAQLAELCRVLFTQRRKQIGGVLGRDARLPDGIDPEARPEALTRDQWLKLADWYGDRA